MVAIGVWEYQAIAAGLGVPLQMVAQLHQEGVDAGFGVS